MADQKRDRELFSNIFCSKHPGDTVARYCQDCRELLCISCIMAVTGDVHRQHAVIPYQRYMKERVQELQELVHRLGTLRLRAEHFVRLLAHYNEEYEKGYNEILESFTVVRVSMAKWKDDQIEDLDTKKTQQLKIISEAASLTSKGVACKGISVKLPRVDIYMQQAVDIVLNLVPMLCYILRPGHSSLKKIRPISQDHTYDDISSTSGSSSADSSVMLGESAYSPRMLWLSRQLALSNSPVSFKQPPSNAKPNHPGMLPVSRKDDLPGQDNDCYSSDEESYLSSLPFHISKEEEEEEEVEEILHNNEIVTVDEDKHSALHHIADKPASLNSKLLTLKKAHSSFLPPPLPPPRPSQGLQDKPILREHGGLNTRPRSTSSPPQIRKFKIDHSITQDTIQNDSVNTPDGADSDYEKMYAQNDTEQCHSDYPLLPAPENEPNYESLPYECILALPRELIIPPKQIIMASCCAVVPSENVCLYDLCISPDGYMIFTDKENSCLRCILGTSVDSKAITKRCKGSPRAIAFDSCDQRILVSTAQGFYQLKCGPNFKSMKEKRLSKDMMPLSLACSTVPVARRKSQCQSLMYATLWPSNGESCAYRFDTNGQFESRISSPDISNKKPHGIDYMKEYLVVTCLRDCTLAKISHMGDSLWDSSVDARRPGILKHPFGVAILPRTEYIAVTERDGHRVSIFSDQGKLILRFGEKGTERGKFDSPRGIAVRMAKELVVVDCGNKRVQIFLLSSFDLPLFPQ